MGRCCLLFSRTRSAPRNLTRFAAQYLARGLPCERFTAALASRNSCITRGRGGWLDLPRGGLAPPILCQLPGALRDRVIRAAGEHVLPVTGQPSHLFADGNCLARQRYDMLLCHFHFFCRDRPERVVEIEIGPLRAGDLTGADHGQRDEAEGMADHIAEASA